MKKKFLFLTLMGAMLLPVNVGAQNLKPYNRQNNSGYRFDGHKIDEVTVKPFTSAGDLMVTKNDAGEYQSGNYISRTINVGSSADFDDQVIFLYQPATKRFLYADGNWGTETVGRHEGFGMPYNIVNPKGENSPVAEHYIHDGYSSWPKGDDDYSKFIGYGIYCEAFEMGHYIGRDQGCYVGEPEFTQNGVKTNRARFFTDRGGSATNIGEWNPTLKGEFNRIHRTAEEEIQQWGIKIPSGEIQNVFTWGFEEVKGITDPNLHLYNICVYLNNVKQPDDTKNKGVDVDYNDNKYTLHKHYVKFESIDPFNNNTPFYALTTANYNTQDNQSSVTGDEDTPDPTDADYYWQIVTRKDLKQMFLLDFKDPYSRTGVVDDNATYLIDDPDFSRPLRPAVNPGGEGVTTYWKESQDDLYYFYNNPFSKGADPGRFSLLHANNNGDLTQEFIPYQYGMYRLDCQGFSYGNATVKMTLSNVQESNVKISDAVTFDNTMTFDALGIKELMQERTADKYKDNLYSDNYATGGLDDWHVENDNAWSTEPVAGGLVLASITSENGQKRPVQILGKTDASGARPVGVYVVGRNRNFTSNHPYVINGGGWDYKQTITVKEGDKIKFGLNPGNYENCVKLDVWYPDNTSDNNHWSATENINAEREHEFTVGGTDNKNITKSGDYIFTFQYNDGSYAVDYYTIQIENQGTPTHVNVNETGKPYAFGESNVKVKLTQQDGGGQAAADWSVRNDDGNWHSEDVTKYNDNEYFARIRYYGENGATSESEKKVVYILGRDDYGIRPVGTYVPGKEREGGSTTINYQVNHDDGEYNDPWVENFGRDGVITLRANDYIKLQPRFTNEEKTHLKRYDWFGPAQWNNGSNKDKYETGFFIDFASAGDYICVAHFDDDSFTLYRVTIKVVGAPDPVHVNVNGTGKPYAFGNPGNYISIATQTYDDYANPYSSLDEFKDYVVTHDRYSVDYAIGKYLYQEENKNQFKKSIYFYVGQNDDRNKPLKIDFNFSGITPANEADKNGTQYDFDNYAAIDNVRLTYLGETPYLLDDNTANQDEFDKIKNVEKNNIPVYLERVFSVNAWNAFVSPVPVNYATLKSTFGEGVNVSEISGLDQENSYRIIFKSVIPKKEEGESETAHDKEVVIQPKHYYLVYPTQITTTTEIYQYDAGNTTVPFVQHKSRNGGFTSLGIHNLTNTYNEDNGLAGELLADYSQFTSQKYDPASGSNHNSIELVGSFIKFQTPGDDERHNCYVFQTKENETRLVHLAAGAPLALPGFRFYIHDTAGGSGAKSFSFVIDGVEDEDEANEISNAVADENTTNGDIYNIAGQKVKGQLSPGVYVKNGKKFLVK